jgi:heat shock protein HtpX
MINHAKTFVLLAGLIALFLAAGQMLGGSQGLMIGGSIGMAMAFGSFWFSDTMVLKGYHARVVTAEQAPELFGMIDELRQRAGLPMPKVAIVPSPQPNAFATGRSHKRAVVAVTEGLLKAMPKNELRGVIAHELAHIKNRDMLTMTMAAGLASVIGYLPYALLFLGRGDDDDGNVLVQIAVALLAPLIAMVIQFAISRQREFAADRLGAEILGEARPLAEALTRIEAMARKIPMNVAPALAPLAQVNPLTGRGGRMSKMMSTHPPTEERVAALLAFDAGR